MMQERLLFRPLAVPPSLKVQKAFRKDAGWAIPDAPLPKPVGLVQWVAVESDKQQIGLARLEIAPPEFCCVSELIINSKFRGRGIGSWLLKNIEQYCVGYGIRRLVLRPEKGTHAFYAALSFVSDPLVPEYLKKDINPFQPKMFFPQNR